MNYAISPYELNFKEGGVRKGFLLHAHEGYADCHPWEEFGELPINEQIKQLRGGKSTPLLEQAFFLAKLDGEARKQKRSLFDQIQMPASHLITSLEELNFSQYKKWGITILKIKLGFRQIEEWLEKSQDWPYQWRIDFNASLSFQQAEQFFVISKKKHAQIDLIEDITPFDAFHWKKWQDQFGICLAADFEKSEGGYPLVCKPCSRPIPHTTERIIITSSLGHPVGQLQAAYLAAKMTPSETGGWLSHFLYEPNPFSELLKIQDGRLLPTEGTGVGFDQLLEELIWI